MLQEVEDTAIRLIDIHDIYPDDAIKQSAQISIFNLKEPNPVS
ncbi:hypothetical protein [Argonema antarcticum]|nr:hypothetical protein [Argonema antarcticum]